MTEKRNRIPQATLTRTIFAANLVKLLAHHYGHLGPITSQQKALHKATGLSFSTIQRACKREAGATIDNIETIALVFRLSSYQMLIPHLIPTDPQVIQGADKSEHQLYLEARRNELNTKKKDPKEGGGGSLNRATKV